MNEEQLTEWQPIETAPKDGTVFLVFTPHDQVGFQYTATYTMNNEIVCIMSLEVPEERPTHWRHLPPPPQYGRNNVCAKVIECDDDGCAIKMFVSDIKFVRR